jgi:hypothetical protein
MSFWPGEGGGNQIYGLWAQSRRSHFDNGGRSEQRPCSHGDKRHGCKEKAFADLHHGELQPVVKLS